MKKNKKLTASIIMALLLQGAAGYTITYAEKINENPGTNWTAERPIEENPDNTIDDKLYYGIYSSGKESITTVDLKGNQYITMDSAHNFFGQSLKSEIYGIYTEDGAVTNWATVNGGEGLALMATGNQALSYGIYTTGHDSQTNIGSENDKNLQITVNAINNENNDDQNIGIDSDKSVVEAIAIYGADGAHNNIYASSITAVGSIQKSNNYTYDIDVLAAKQAMDEAAEKYVQMVGNYDSYSSGEEYQNALLNAQTLLDTAVASYQAVVGDGAVIGVYGVDSAINEVTVNGDISTEFTTQLAATTTGKNVTERDDRIAVSMPLTAIGVYGENGATNIIDVNNIRGNISSIISSTQLSNENSGIASQDVTIVAPINLFGIYGDNAAKNFVDVDRIDLNASQSLAGVITEGSSNEDTKQKVNIITPMQVYGIYGAQEAINEINVDNININNYFSGSIYIGDNRTDGANLLEQDIKIIAPVNVAAIKGESGAVNIIEVDQLSVYNHVSASINDSVAHTASQNVDYAVSVDVAGINASDRAKNIVTVGNINIYSDATFGGGMSDSQGKDGTVVQYLNTFSPQNVTGIKGSGLAQNVITADRINVYNSVNASIVDNSSAGNVQQDYTLIAPIHTSGIYGTTGALNIVTAEKISVDGNLSASINDSSYTNDLLRHDIEVTMPFAVNGVYGRAGAFNNVKTENIAVNGRLTSLTVMMSMDNRENQGPVEVNQKISADIPFNIAGVYGETSAVNNVSADQISVYGELQQANINSYTNISGSDTVNEQSLLLNIPLSVAGVFGTSESVNNIMVDKIKVTGYSGGQYVYDYDYTEDGTISEDNISTEITINSPVNVYGIYATDGALVNLHSKESGGIVTIEVGGAQYNYDQKENEDVGVYSIYVKDAKVVIHDNVEVVSTDVNGYTVENPITYLNNAVISFGGYNDYYDEYYYDFETEETGKVIVGSGAFHTYTSGTGQLELHGSNTLRVNTDLANNKSDKLIFNNISAESEAGVNYVEIASDVTFTGDNDTEHVEGHTVIVEIKETDKALEAEHGLDSTEGAQNLDGLVINADGSAEMSFVGKTSTLDNPLERYNATPTVISEATETGRDIVITGIDFEKAGPSEGLMTSVDSQLAMRNFWRIDNSTLMQRLGELRLQNELDNDGVWVRYTKGEMQLDSSYNRRFKQDYNQFQIGYDEKMAYNGGQLYLGGAISHTYGNVEYVLGDGKAKNTAVAYYATWLGDKGHYYDLVARVGKLETKFDLVDLSENQIHGDYNTYHYGVSGEYGYRKLFTGGYFIEPQVQLSLGHIQGINYKLSNGVEMKQSGINSALVRLGVLTGREFEHGNAYVKASVLKDIGGKGTVNGYYDGKNMSVDTIGNKAWYEVGIGTNIKLGEANNYYLDVSKSFGGNVKQKWQINTGVSWSF